MKLVDIINKYCNCELKTITLIENDKEHIIYNMSIDNADNLQEYSISFNIENLNVSVKYISNKELSKESIHLLSDLVSVYIENVEALGIAEKVSNHQDIYSGQASLEDMVQTITKALVDSSLFDKVAIMFYNEKLMQMKGVCMADKSYNKENALAFKNRRISIKKSTIKKLYECNKKGTYLLKSFDFADKIFKYIDNKSTKTNPLIIVPIINNISNDMANNKKIYGVLATYSSNKYTNTNIIMTKYSAYILNNIIMAVLANKKYEYTTSFYKEIESDMKSKQSLVTLGNYVATIAHEVKNPLISIGGFAKRLVKSVENSNLKRMASIIASESIRLEHLTEDVLSFSRKRPPKKETIYLKTFFDDIKLLFESRMAEHNFNIDINIPEDAYIYADIDQIKQVVVNLIGNAMNAIGNNGTVSIDFQKKDNKTSIIISDTGPGIPIEIMPNLFKPFFTTSNSGTGLGLPISRKILNSHNGDLTVCNGKQGAIFTITLPVE